MASSPLVGKTGRAGRSFRKSETGPQRIFRNRRAYGAVLLTAGVMFGLARANMHLVAGPAPEAARPLGSESAVRVWHADGAEAYLPAAAASSRAVAFALTRVSDDALPPLPDGLINVTERGGGFLLAPAGTELETAVTIVIPLALDRYSALELRTLGVRAYLWREAEGRWTALPPAANEDADGRVSGVSNELGVTIAGILPSPDHPQPLSHDSNSIKGIAAASPADGVDLVAPPEPTNEGDARVQYSIRLPAGRGAFSPTLTLQYSSDQGNGPLGVGWSLPVSRIEVDTRWGVPSYGEDGRSERYMLDGADLVPRAVPAEARCARGQAPLNAFARRVYDDTRIYQCRSGADVYWEVTKPDGVQSEYGTTASRRLADYRTSDHIAAWYLERVVDANENVTTYTYCEDSTARQPSCPSAPRLPGPPAEPFVQLYLRSIEYTSHPGLALSAAYAATLSWDCTDRPDPIVSGKTGFKVVTRCRLEEIAVTYRDERGANQPIRAYRLEYHDEQPVQTAGPVLKSLLAAVMVSGAEGGRFYRHNFDYRPLELGSAFGPVENWGLNGAASYPLTNAARSLDHTAQDSHDFSQSGGYSFSFAIGDVGLGCTVSGATGFTIEDPAPELVYRDIDGDAIPDRVWKIGGAIVGAARAVPSGGVMVYVPYPSPVRGLSEIGLYSTISARQTGQFGCSAAGVVSASTDHGLSLSHSRATSIMTDADGDGFTDLLQESGFRRGLPSECRTPGSDVVRGTCASDGLPICDPRFGPCFTAGSLLPRAVISTPAPPVNPPQLSSAAPGTSSRSLPAAPAAPSPSVPDGPGRLLPDTMITEDFAPRNPVLRWDAAHAGTASIYARAKRKRAGAGDDVSIHFLRVSDFHSASGGELLRTVAIPSADMEWQYLIGTRRQQPMPSASEACEVLSVAWRCQVHAGESFVFVFDAGKDRPKNRDGRFLDEVDFEFVVSYETICPAGASCRALTSSDRETLDATGRPAYRFEFPGDFRASDLPRQAYWKLVPPVGPTAPGRDPEQPNVIELRAQKLRQTPVPVHVRIRCESLNATDATSGACPLGTVLAEHVFAPGEMGPARTLRVPVPAPFETVGRGVPADVRLGVCHDYQSVDVRVVEQTEGTFLAGLRSDYNYRIDDAQDVASALALARAHRRTCVVGRDEGGFPATINLLTVASSQPLPNPGRGACIAYDPEQVVLTRLPRGNVWWWVAMAGSVSLHEGFRPDAIGVARDFVALARLHRQWCAIASTAPELRYFRDPVGSTAVYRPMSVMAEIDGENGFEIAADAVSATAQVIVRTVRGLQETAGPSGEKIAVGTDDLTTFPSDSPLRSDLPILFRVHPRRTLIPFASEQAGDQILVRATAVRNRHPLTVSLVGPGIQPGDARFRLDVPAGTSATKEGTLSLPGTGQYYLRAYTEASFDTAASANVTASRRVITPYYAVLANRGNAVSTYGQLSTLRIAVLQGSAVEQLARKLFPSATFLAIPTTPDATMTLPNGSIRILSSTQATVTYPVVGTVTVPLAQLPVHAIRATGADAALVRPEQVPWNIDAPPPLLWTGFYVCCRTAPQPPLEGMRYPLSFYEAVPVNVVTADFGAGLVVPRIVGEVPHSSESWGGGHHGFFYGIFNGEEQLTCIGPLPCRAAPSGPSPSARSTRTVSSLFLTAPASATALPPTSRIDFEDLAQGREFRVGGSFTSAGVRVTAEPFQWMNNVWTTDGATIVEVAAKSGGSGKDFHTRNINAAFIPSAPVATVRVTYGEYGGNVNLRVNGEFRKADNLSSLNGAVIGGARVSVSFKADKSSEMGTLTLEAQTRSIESWILGGQELWIDDVLVWGASSQTGGSSTPSDCPNRDATSCTDRPGSVQCVDGDGDGICQDRCESAPEDFDGIEDADGCPDGPNDSDGDGEPDTTDVSDLVPNSGSGPTVVTPSRDEYCVGPDGSRLSDEACAQRIANRFEAATAGGGGGSGCMSDSGSPAAICPSGVTPGGQGAGIPALQRTWTFGFSKSAGVTAGYAKVGASLGVAANLGLLWTDADTGDWNGDGVVDFFGTEGVLLGGRNRFVSYGFTCPNAPCLLGPGVKEQLNTSFGANFGMSTGLQSLKVDSAGKVVDQKSASASLGSSGFRSRSQTTTQKVDINGDGLPDVVYARNGDPNVWVRLNLGYRLGAPESYGPLAGSTQGGGMEGVHDDLAKLLSEISGSAPLGATDNTTNGTSVGASFHVEILGFGGGGSFSYSRSATTTEMLAAFMDVNGDGLLDFVERTTSAQPMKAWLNTGSRFLPSVDIATPSWSPALSVPSNTIPPGAASGTRTADLLDASTSQFETWGGSATGVFWGVVGTTTYSFTRGHSRSRMGTFDADGDGLPDRVLRTGSETSGAIQVSRNRLGGAYLLTTVHRPLGGRLEISYNRTVPTAADPHTRWVLASSTLRNVDARQGLSAPLIVTHDYQSPYYDRYERSFLGFATVISVRGDGRRVTREYDNRRFWKKGLLLKETISSDAGVPLRQVEHEWAETLVDATGSRVRARCLRDLILPRRYLGESRTLDQAFETPCDARRPELRTIVERHFEDGSAAAEQTREFSEYDDHGNITLVTEQTNWSAPGSAPEAERAVARVRYARLPVVHVFDRAESVEVYAGREGGDLLRRRTATYDCRGNLATHTTWTGSEPLNVDPTPVYSLTRFGIDPGDNCATEPTTGFVSAITDVNGYTVTYVPDRRTHQIAMETRDGFGLTSRIGGYDFRFQAATTTIDANGVRLVKAFDQFGRLQSATGAYEAAVGAASVTVEYPATLDETGGVPRAITTNTAVQAEGRPPVPRPGSLPAASQTVLRTARFVDGLGREIQSQVDAYVEGVSGRVVSGAREYDGAGRVVREGEPEFRRGPTIEHEALRFDETRLTSKQYDFLDRVVVEVRPGRITTRQAYDVADHPRVPSLVTLRTRVTDPKENLRFLHRDVDGRVIAIVERASSTDASGATIEKNLVTSYDYDSVGNLLRIENANGVARSYAYDQAGRRVAISSGDTGRSEYAYDRVGNLIASTDEALCDAAPPLIVNCGDARTIRRVYDRNRLVRIDYPAATDIDLVYGDSDRSGVCRGLLNTRGRICRVNDGGGYELREYGALGEVFRRARVARVASWQRERRFTTIERYDSFGRLYEAEYPDGERLRYQYDPGGRVQSVRGTRPYIETVSYDVYGKPVRTVYGNGVIEANEYERETRRLSVRTLCAAGVAQCSSASADSLQRIAYAAYDPIGNVEHVITTRHASAKSFVSADRLYTYDDLYRLTTFNYSYEQANGEGASTSRITGGYVYDDVGNMLHQRASSVGGAVDHDWSYSYSDPHRPNLPVAIGPYTMTHNARGAVAELVPATIGGPVDARYAWDDAGRLAGSESDRGAVSSTYAYDMSDRRVRREITSRIGSVDTSREAHLYPTDSYVARARQSVRGDCSGAECTTETGTRTKTIQFDGRTIAIISSLVTPEMMQSPENTLSALSASVRFLHADLVQSTTLATDSSGAIASAFEYLPFGEVVSNNSNEAGSVLETAGFNGKSLDAETGLLYYGARYSMPQFGRWMSPDPVGLVHPEQIDATKEIANLYAFSSANPTSRFDAAGTESTVVNDKNVKDTVTDVLDPILPTVEWALEQTPYKGPALAVSYLGAAVSGYQIGRDYVKGDTTSLTENVGSTIFGMIHPAYYYAWKYGWKAGRAIDAEITNYLGHDLDFTLYQMWLGWHEGDKVSAGFVWEPIRTTVCGIGTPCEETVTYRQRRVWAPRE